MARVLNKDLAIKYFVWTIVAVYPACVLLLQSSFTLVMLAVVAFGTVIFYKDWKAGELSDHACEILLLKVGMAGLALSLISLFAGGRLVDISSAELEYFDKQLRFMFFVPFLILMKRTEMPEKIIWWGAIAAALCAGAYSIITKIITSEIARVSIINNPINFAYFSVLAAFVSINGLFFFMKMKRYFVCLPILAFFIGLSGAIFSGSRGAWLAIPVLTVLTIVNFKKHFNPAHVYAAAISGLVLTAIIIGTVGDSIVQDRLAQIGSEVKKYYAGSNDLRSTVNSSLGSVGLRLEMYRVSLDISKNNPFFGAGPGRYQYSVNEYIDAGKINSGIKNFRYPHNDYLTVATCTGIPGLVIFVITVYFLPLYILYIYAGKDSSQPLFWAGVIIVAGYMIFSLSNSTMFKNVRIYYYCLMLCAICASLKSRGYGSKNE
jgi:O-antigen ligase